MNFLRWNVLRVAGSFIAGLLLLTLLLAQAAMNNQPASLGPNVVSAQTPPSPPSPALKSPVDFFRELLAMDLAERKQFLAIVACSTLLFVGSNGIVWEHLRDGHLARIGISVPQQAA